MSGFLDDVVPIEHMGQRSLWVIYGKSGSGKTELLSTFPKKQLYIQVGDDGSNTIQHKPNIDGKRANTVEDLKGTLQALIAAKGKGYKSVAVDTFSMITNVWVKENITDKNKKMTQQAWGDLKVVTEELIRLAWELALYTNVILTLHEATDIFEGLEDEIVPDICPNTTKGARTYLEGMANYGIHTTKLQKEVIRNGKAEEIVKFAAHFGANSYYWTKLQIPKSIEIPAIVVNPTYRKLMKYIQAEPENS